MSGVLTISLDFELHWGGFEKWPLQKPGSEIREPEPFSYNQYFLNTRQVIPDMLALFQNYEVHVTWAAVGMLLHESRESLLRNAPALKPTYKVRDLSAYHYMETMGVGEDERSDPFHFASSLVGKILSTAHQELGTHTFSHYYCNEVGQTLEQFREDLSAAQRVAKTFGCTLRSLVFPRNQFNDAYLKVCFELGITAVRSNPLDWFWNIESTQEESLWRRLNRGADAYFPVGKKSTYRLDSLQVQQGFPLCIPASRLLRPYNPRERLLNDLKISRVKHEMSRAARQHEVYHLWWHPHNFGRYPEQSLVGLRAILDHLNVCRKQYGIQSLNMGEITRMATAH